MEIVQKILRKRDEKGNAFKNWRIVPKQMSQDEENFPFNYLSFHKKNTDLLCFITKNEKLKNLYRWYKVVSHSYRSNIARLFFLLINWLVGQFVS